MHRRSGPPVRVEYYAQVELLPDEELFSASQIASRKFDPDVQPEEWSKMADALRKFASRNQMFDRPDNCQIDDEGKPVFKNRAIQLLPGDRSRKWRGSVWKSNLFDEDRMAIREYLKSTQSSEEQDMPSKKAELGSPGIYMELGFKSLMRLALVTGIVVAGFWSWHRNGSANTHRDAISTPSQETTESAYLDSEDELGEKQKASFSGFVMPYRPRFFGICERLEWNITSYVWKEGKFPDGKPFPAIYLVTLPPMPDS